MSDNWRLLSNDAKGPTDAVPKKRLCLLCRKEVVVIKKAVASKYVICKQCLEAYDKGKE